MNNIPDDVRLLADIRAQLRETNDLLGRILSELDSNNLALAEIKDLLGSIDRGVDDITANTA